MITSEIEETEPVAFTANQLDTALYVAIAVLGTAQGYVAAHMLPAWTAVPIGLALVGCTAWKAKRSVGTTDSKKSDQTQGG